MAFLVPFAFRAPSLIRPSLSLPLVLALEYPSWQIVATVSMLLNAGLMLLAASVLGTVFFLPMVGYVVSAGLVGYVWVKRRKEAKTA